MLRTRQFARPTMRRYPLRSAVHFDFVTITPVARQAANTFTIGVSCFVSPNDGINITPESPGGYNFYTWSEVNPSGARMAGEGEVEVKLWGGPSAADWDKWVYDGFDGQRRQGPRIDDGGWNVVPSQPTLTNSSGYVKLGDPNFSDGQQSGTILTMPDGWYRLTMRHRTSGYEAALRFRIDGQQYNWGSTSVPVVSNVGTPMPPGFKQAQFYPSPGRAAKVLWTAKGWRNV